MKLPIDGRRLARIALSAAPVAFALLAGPHGALAITANYGSGAELGTSVNRALENIAATIRDILGGAALISLASSALVMHFVHDPRAKDTAKSFAIGSVIGLMLAAFAPTIISSAWNVTGQP